VRIDHQRADQIDLHDRAPKRVGLRLDKKTTAMAVIARRQKSGEQAAVEWIRESAKSQIPLVRR